MDKRFIGILIIIAGLFVIGGIVYVLFFYDFNKENKEQVAPIEQQQEDQSQTKKSETEPPKEQASKNEPKIEYPKPEQKIKKERDVTADDLKRIAASFSERFGSYSNHSGYSNIVDLEIFMSKKMKSWADNFVKESRERQTSNDIYYGITTKSFQEKVKSFDDDIGKSEILVKTQRRESRGTIGNNSSFYQDILISFIKEDGSWKIDSAYWQKN